MVKKEKTKRNFWEILMGFVIPSSQSFLGQPDVSFPNTELSEISGFCFLEVFYSLLGEQFGATESPMLEKISRIILSKLCQIPVPKLHICSF